MFAEPEGTPLSDHPDLLESKELLNELISATTLPPFPTNKQLFAFDDRVHVAKGGRIDIQLDHYRNAYVRCLKGGELHREDGPALMTENLMVWYKDGLIHREDGPAVIAKAGAHPINIGYLSGMHSYNVVASRYNSAFADFRLEWIQKGKAYREDGPAVLCSNGFEFYDNDIEHRTEGPSAFYIKKDDDLCQVRYKRNGKPFRANGEWTNLFYKVKEWRNEDDILHRDPDEGPASISPDHAYYCVKGQYHRKEEDGPAVSGNGQVCYYQDGKIHRVNGPAVSRMGYDEFYWQGRRCSEARHNKYVVDARLENQRKGLLISNVKFI